MSTGSRLCQEFHVWGMRMQCGGTMFLAAIAAGLFNLVFYSGLGAHATVSERESSEVLFQQSNLEGLKGNLYVPLAEHKPPPTGAFHLVLWQPNPNRSDGMLVPTSWTAGDKTGFYPSLPLEQHQAGFRSAAGSTVVQISGDTVGAYINSADLPGGSHLSKMMIAPSLTVSPAEQVHPFARTGRTISVSLELQVPTAVDAHTGGSESRISADLLFVDGTSGTRISYGCNLFFNGHPHREPGGHIRLDEDSQNMMINSVVGLQNPWLTTEDGSAVSQGSTWVGWKTFRFSITEKNFKEALRALKQRDAGARASVNPADYTFAKFHLNAELYFKSAPAEMGWSMRHAKVMVVNAANPL